MKISVVIVNYKTLDLTRQTVDTLVENCPLVKTDGEIIIVDNASGDGSFEALQKSYPDFQIIESQENTGFTGGNNIGIKRAKGEYVLLLNSDTKSIEDPISKIVQWMDEHKEVGISSIKLVNDDGSVQPSGGYFPFLPQVFFWMFFIDDLPIIGSMIKSFHPAAPPYDKSKKFYDENRQLDWVTGAYFLVRREVIDKIGYLDEQMFMYTEETEYCYRAKKAGFACWFVPVAKIIHLGGGSQNSKMGPLVGEYKNILYFYKKHMPSWQLPVARFFLKCGAVLRILLFGFIGHNKEAEQTYVQALHAI